MKYSMFAVGFLFFSMLVNTQAWSAQPAESAEACYQIIERVVGGSKIEVKDRFFRFQDHGFMKDLGGIDDKTKPPTQYRSFTRSNANGREQVTMQIFKDKDLPDQSSLPASERVVKRFEITQFQYADCTDIKNPKCLYDKKTFEMLDPQSKTCFKAITEENSLPNSKRTLLSSAFCKKWYAYYQTKKGNEREAGKEYLAKNPAWQDDFKYKTTSSSIKSLMQAVENCKVGTAPKSAAWDAQSLPMPTGLPTNTNFAPGSAQ